MKHYSHIYLLCFTYLLIICLQLIYFKFFNNTPISELKKKILFNVENSDAIKNHIDITLKERLKLLNNNQMSYNDWIKYNNQNINIEYNGHNAYIFIFEAIFDNESDTDKNFITKTHVNVMYLNNFWSDVVKDCEDKLIHTPYTTDPHLIANMFNMSSDKYTTYVEYYWTDQQSERPILKHSRVLRYYDPETRRTGVIGAGIEIKDLIEISLFKYIDQINIIYPVFISVLVFLASITIYKLSGNHHFHYKSVIFLIFMNIYLTYFLSKSEVKGATTIEEEKEEDINSGIMSASFLVGVNVFILSALEKFIKLNLFTESGFVFSISLILLLFSTLKATDQITINELVSERLGTQLIFNCSVILNLIILINYMIYVMSLKLGKNIVV